MFSHDGRLVLAAGGKTAWLWETATGKEVRQFTAHSNYVDSAVFSHNALYVLTASEDGTLQMWETATGKEVRKFKESVRCRVGLSSCFLSLWPLCSQNQRYV